MYCFAIMDIYSRKILGWSISNSLEAKWCVDVLEDAVRRYGLPEIVNSDQGSQFTSALWTYTLESLGIKISMDGKGRAIDNRWIERFWRTLKYKYIYLNPAENGIELYEGVRDYINYYNEEKVHHTFKEVPHERYQKSIQESIFNQTQLLTNKPHCWSEIWGVLHGLDLQLAEYFNFYNHERRHESLDYELPASRMRLDKLYLNIFCPNNWGIYIPFTGKDL